MILKGRAIVEGRTEGEVVYTDYPITFYGGVDMRTGTIIQTDHPLRGTSIADKVLVFPYGVGSTVGSYVIYGLKKYGVSPRAMILREVDTVVATGAILAGIPTVDRIDIEKLKHAKKVRIDNDKIEVIEF